MSHRSDLFVAWVYDSLSLIEPSELTVFEKQALETAADILDRPAPPKPLAEVLDGDYELLPCLEEDSD